MKTNRMYREISTTKILQDLNWTSIHQMIDQTMIKLTLRILKTEVPDNIIEIKDPTRTLRGTSLILQTQRYHLNLSIESFKNQAPRLYNLLPFKIRDDSMDTKRLKLEII